MIGLGRMNASMVPRLMKKGHECVVYDSRMAAVSHREMRHQCGGHVERAREVPK